VLQPLRKLAAQANRLTEGDFTALKEPCGGIREIDALRRSLFAMVGHVRRVQEQKRQYADAITGVQEAERTRIARELHDDTVQSFIGIAQGIDLASTWITERPGEAAQRLKDVRAEAVEAVTTLRNLIGDLRPPALEELGLVPALRMLAGQAKPVATHLSVVGIERRLGEDHELTLFRSAQETLRNAQKQSGATDVKIEVGYDTKQVSLTIEDNGNGFSVPPQVDLLATRGHYGLLGIQERVQNLQGTFNITSKPGKGTTVSVQLPSAEDLQPTGDVQDPVCSAIIKPHQAYGSSTYENQVYYFCCPVCQGAFQRSPALYLNNKEQALAIESAR
jgi:signal transduction histidine kinase/YHS domain-containing protein